jgi:hypothetical protein
LKNAVETLGKERGGIYRLILHQCALSFITADSWNLIELFALYREFKQFPFPGTILEQPARMIDAFRIFQAEIEAIKGPEEPLTQTELIDVLTAAFGAKK